MTFRPREQWTHLGDSANCAVHEVREDVVAFVPQQDIRETQETARDNLAFQARHWAARGHGGAVIIFMDPILEQDAAARGVYATEAGDVGTRCFALIGESYFAMAAAAVYTGLAKPSVPLNVFRTLDDAVPWIEEQLAGTAPG